MSSRLEFFSDVVKEVEEARGKFPSSDLLGYAFAEESGELIKAILDRRNGKGISELAIYQEAVQVVAMVIRLMEEGCPELGLPRNFMFTEEEEGK